MTATLPGRLGRGVSAALRKWLLLVVVVLVWEIAARAGANLFFPPPSKIAVTGAHLWFTGPAKQLFLTDSVFQDVFPSLGRTLAGWLLAGVLGVAIGVLAGRSRTGMDYIGPLLSFFRAIPPPALIPIFMMLFGLGSGMQIGSIIFSAIWPVLLNTVDGVRSVDDVKVATARSFRTPWVYWTGLVVLPAAMPKILAGLRLALSLALLLMVISEFVGAPHGMGNALIDAQTSYDYRAMWAWLVLLGIIGYGLNAAFLAVERRVLAWQPALARD